jgi:hypothetical protein
MVGGLSQIECGVQMMDEHISSALPWQVNALRPQVCGAEPRIATRVNLLKGAVV